MHVCFFFSVLYLERMSPWTWITSRIASPANRDGYQSFFRNTWNLHTNQKGFVPLPVGRKNRPYADTMQPRNIQLSRVIRRVSNRMSRAILRPTTENNRPATGDWRPETGGSQRERLNSRLTLSSPASASIEICHCCCDSCEPTNRCAQHIPVFTRTCCNPHTYHNATSPAGVFAKFYD